jgi:hypothetical protein
VPTEDDAATLVRIDGLERDRLTVRTSEPELVPSFPVMMVAQANWRPSNALAPAVTPAEQRFSVP